MIRVFLGSGLNRIVSVFIYYLLSVLFVFQHGILVDPVTRLSDLEAFQIVYLWMARFVVAINIKMNYFCYSLYNYFWFRACINSYELHHENDPHYATGPPASTILRLDVATVIALP